MASGNIVIIIGNGFDLNFGYQTKYSHFANSHHFTDHLNNPLFKFLYHKKESNWFDIENELFLYQLKERGDDIETQYKALKSFLCEYLKDALKENKIDPGVNAYQVINSVKRFENVNIIDFNFTNTVSDIIMNYFNDEERLNFSLHAIHGRANDGKIIFGIGDNLDVKRENLYLIKSFPVYYNSVNVSEFLLNAERIIVFGHSLGESDHAYFLPFFTKIVNPDYDSSHLEQFQLYYFDDKAYHNLMYQINILTKRNMTTFKSKSKFKAIKVK
jgi:hypothetical protein